MGILITVLTIVDVLIALLIIALVLVQQSKSTGLGTTFGGGGSDSLFGAHAATHLSKLTVIFATLFIVITLALAILSGHQSRYNQSIMDLTAPQTATAQTQTVEHAKSPALNTSKTLSIATDKVKADSKTASVETKAAKK